MKTTSWYMLLDQLIGRSGLSRSQIATRAQIKVKTLTSWLRGDVKKPRQWQPLARALIALNASSKEADEVLKGAGLPLTRYLVINASDEERQFLSHWLQDNVPFMVPDLQVLHLFGRQDELEQAKRSLHLKRRAILIGMGGIGKTTLAIELAHQLREQFPDGILWGDLRLSAPESILNSWGQVLNISMDRLSDFKSRAAVIRSVVARKRLLIILDDVIDSTPALQMIPAQHFNCSVLITTRSSETGHIMAKGQRGIELKLPPISRQASLDLLSNIISYEQVENEKDVASALAELLGDLPLALNICAALCTTSGLSLQNLVILLTDLQTRIAHLQMEQKPIVRLAFEQSFELLDEQMKTALVMIGVFEGRSFTDEAFAAISDIEMSMAIFILGKLCHRSLLTRIKVKRADNQVQSQYQQHPLLASFSLEKLPPTHISWSQFSLYYLQFIKMKQPKEQILSMEWSHILSGMQIAFLQNNFKNVLEYEQILTPIWKKRGLYSLARQGYVWAYQSALDTKDLAKAALIQQSWGYACLEQSDYDIAKAHFLNAQNMFEELSDPANVAETDYQMSRLYLELDLHKEAEISIQKAWRTYQSQDNIKGLGRALYQLANIKYYSGAYDSVINLIHDAIKSQSHMQDHIGLLRSHMLMASAYLQIQNLEEAEKHCQEAKSLTPIVNDSGETAIYYSTYADVLRKKGNFAEAYTYGNLALRQVRKISDSNSEINILILLAGNEINWNDAETERNKVERGLAYCQLGFELCDTIGYQVGKSFLLLMEGRLLNQKQANDAACQAWYKGEKLANQLHHEWLQNRFHQLISENCSDANYLPNHLLDDYPGL